MKQVPSDAASAISRTADVPGIRHLARHSFVYGIASLAQSATGFLVLPILANRLSTALFGAYSMLQMTIVFTQAVFYLGISSALQRSYYDAPEGESRAQIFSTSLFLTLFGALSLGSLGAVLRSWISLHELGSTTFSGDVFLAVLTSALMILNQFFLTYLRLRQASGWVAVFAITSLLVQLSATWYLVIYAGFELTGAMLAGIFTQLVLVIPLACLSRKETRWAFSWPEAKIQLAYGIPSLLAGFGLVFIDWSDRIVLQQHLSLKEVGVYSLSYRMASAINAVLVVPFTQIWLPIAMEYRNSPSIKSLFQKVFTLYTAMGAAALIAATFLMREILLLIITKPDYQAAFGILPIVMCGVLFYGLTNITSMGVLYSRRLMPMVIVYYVLGLLRFGVNWLIVPKAGYVGAAWIALGSYILLPIIIFVLARRSFAVALPWLRGSGAIFLGLLVALGVSRGEGGLLLRAMIVGMSCVGVLLLGAGHYFKHWKFVLTLKPEALSGV